MLSHITLNTALKCAGTVDFPHFFSQFSRAVHTFTCFSLYFKTQGDQPYNSFVNILTAAPPAGGGDCVPGYERIYRTHCFLNDTRRASTLKLKQHKLKSRVQCHFHNGCDVTKENDKTVSEI